MKECCEKWNKRWHNVQLKFDYPDLIYCPECRESLKPQESPEMGSATYTCKPKQSWCECGKPTPCTNHECYEDNVCDVCHLPIKQRIEKLDDSADTDYSHRNTIYPIVDKINELVDYCNDLEKLDDEWYK